MQTRFMLLAVLLVWLPPSGFASAGELLISDESIINSGYHVYQKHCTACHGEDGRGGTAENAAGGATAAPDLAALAERNGGVFPFWELYETISGNELMPAHGTRVMPIWGQELAFEPGVTPEERAVLVRGRILALMAYLATLQSH